MQKITKQLWHLGMTLIAFGIFFGTTHLINAQTSTEPIPLMGYAWGAAKDTPCTTTPCEGSGIGWILFRGNGYGVNIVGDAVIGTAKSPLLGWLDFGELSGFPISNSTYCGSTGNCNAHFEGDTLYGWARLRANTGDNSDWDGWIALHGPNFRIVKVTTTDGRFSLEGRAWGSSGFGPGWIDFPENALPPERPQNPTDNKCAGVCSGGGTSPADPEYSCTGQKNDDRSVTWTAHIDNPESGVEYEYSFVSAGDDGFAQDKGNNETYKTNPYDPEVDSAAMRFSVFKNDTPVVDNLECTSVGLSTPTNTSLVGIKAKKTNGVESVEITVSLGEMFTIISDIGLYNKENCNVNSTPFTTFGSPYSETGAQSKEYILSCTQEDLNDGETQEQSVYVHVVDDGQRVDF